MQDPSKGREMLSVGRIRCKASLRTGEAVRRRLSAPGGQSLLRSTLRRSSSTTAPGPDSSNNGAASPSTYPEAWVKLAEKELKGKPVDSLLYHTPEEITLKPLYTSKDIEGISSGGK